jgi:hypothetical protein
VVVGWGGLWACGEQLGAAGACSRVHSYRAQPKPPRGSGSQVVGVQACVALGAGDALRGGARARSGEAA